jgi:hypothetical protein
MLGVVIISMPIGLLASNFQEAYKFNNKKDIIIERYYERMDKIDPSKSMNKEQRFIKNYKRKLRDFLGPKE